MSEKCMNAAEIVEAFGGTKLDPVELTRYESWAMGLFHDKRYVTDPNLEITLQLDITQAALAYEASYSHVPGASLTAYLKWMLLRTMAKHPCFSYRDLEGEWYRFDRLPLFFPVATGKKERFQEVLIGEACALDWEAFCREYRKGIDRAMEDSCPYDPIPYEVWNVAHFIGNLPELQFTSFHLHAPAVQTGRPMFYFGKRYGTADGLFMPLYALFDHSNLDPVVINLFLKDFEQLAAGQG